MTQRPRPEAIGSWPTPAGYLYGYVDTSVTGYQKARDDTGAVTVTVASGYYRADALITALDTALSAQSFGASHTNGQVIVTTNGGDVLVWPDRLGWALGYGTEPGDEGTFLQNGEDAAAPYVAPIMIPYLGADWSEVDTSREITLEVDRTRRGLPGVWGAARIWRWSLTLDEYAFEALQQGWCLRGKVAIEGSESSALGGSQADGALTGYALGLSGVEWLGPTRSHCRATLIVASEV